MSRTGTNFVRFAVAALLGVSACLVAWWPQSAAGSGEIGTFSAAAAAPTQKTPTPTKTPTATVAPTTAAPTTAAPPPPPASPTHKPTKKPTHKPTHKPTTLHNNGGSHHSSGGSTPKPPPSKPTHSTGSSGSTSAPYTPPVASTTSTPAKPTSTPTASAPTSAATSAAVAPTPTAPTTTPTKGDQAADDAETYDTYLTSSEPVETKSAPVWVVPGILLVLTSMLALLGGVLGRGTRPAVARVKSSDDDVSDG